MDYKHMLTNNLYLLYYEIQECNNSSLSFHNKNLNVLTQYAFLHNQNTTYLCINNIKLNEYKNVYSNKSSIQRFMYPQEN